jgi:hypothetical protein
MLPNKIISGGQTGADRAGLDFALANDIEHGGWCPALRRSEDGPIPERYRLRCTAQSDYQERTKLNVRDSDATVIFNRGGRLSAGSALTLRLCERQERPMIVIEVHDHVTASAAQIDLQGRQLAEFLAFYRPKVLNVAGNREHTAPGISKWVGSVLASAWAQFAEVSKTIKPLAESQANLFASLDAREDAQHARGGRR